MSNNLYRVVRDSFIKATNGDFLHFSNEDQETMIANVINGLPKETVEYFS